MDLNQNLKLKIKDLKLLVILAVSVNLILLIYNYIIKPVDLDIILLNDELNNQNSFELVIIPKNELNFKVPFLINEIETQILEGKDLIEIIDDHHNILKIKPIDIEKEGRVSIQLSIPERQIRKVFEFYISSHKA